MFKLVQSVASAAARGIKRVFSGPAQVVAGVSTGLAITGAHAAIDTTAAVANISDANTAVLALGVASFGVAVSVKLYKWLRAAL